MSECHIFDGWCSVHGGRESCTASGQVPHLIARAEAAEAEVERLTEALAERDRRIEAALALHVPERVVISDIGGEDTYDVCSGCGVFLDEEDCPTLLALDGTQ